MFVAPVTCYKPLIRLECYQIKNIVERRHKRLLLDPSDPLQLNEQLAVFREFRVFTERGVSLMTSDVAMRAFTISFVSHDYLCI